MLFASAQTQATGNAQSEPDVTVPGLMSDSSESGGMRTRTYVDLPSVRYEAQINLNQPTLTLGSLDVRAFALRDNQVGINRSVDVSPNTRAQKFVNPDGSQLIVLIIKSSGASGTGVHFRNFALADGEEVYVYGSSPDSIVFGPFTQKGPWGSGEFWSGTLDGDTVVVEFYKRTDETGQGFEISEVSHMFTELDWRLRSDEPDVLNCEVDASCYSDREKNSVGRILFNDNGVFVCTGTLLNNIAEDRTPYFLTANHCINTNAVAQTVEVYWFYQTTSCNSGVLRSVIHSSPGASLLRAQALNDFSLLRLQHNAPAGVWFSGWTSGLQTIGTGVFGLHHPGGYIPPSVGSYLRRATGSVTNTNYDCPATGLVNGYRADWASGLAEPGASGSGLFTLDGHYLVGVLSCGPTPTCSDRHSDYSKFAEFYPQIREYIYSGAPSAPLATTATFVTSHSFRANWHAVNGASGYRLDVAADNSFTSYIPGYQNLNVGNGLSHLVTGLSPSSRYYYRLRAYNGNGTSDNSNVLSVMTRSPTGSPAGVTNPATLIASHSAKLNGSLYPHGLSTTVYFQYGRTTAYGSRTPNQTKTGNSYQNVSANISGLRSDTIYHFRIVGTNAGGTAYGRDRMFTTH
jgi:fibronectin type III domain protein/trypsin